ncbi:substrate-binding periplasmic protein [Inhella sp.]|uniref:substrate-binding periplasmic protein n=1 Tax=Inhella sp. TaxID=1921806 RepID=UPI0035B35396
MKRCGSTLLWLLALCLGPPAWAQCSRPLKVGVSALGWSVFEEKGQLRGMVPDLMRELEARSGCTLSLQFRPRARVQLEFMSGQLDLMPASVASAEREAAGHYVPYAATAHDLLLRAEAPKGIDSMAKLLAAESVTVGLVRGVALGPRLAPGIARLSELGRVEMASDYENLAERMKAGRFQAAFFPSAIHAKQRHDGLLPPQVRVVMLAESRPEAVGLYIQRQSVPEADRRRLETALRQMVQDGAVEAIYRKYLSAEEVRRLFRSAR